jgi:hypothetical protein
MDLKEGFFLSWCHTYSAITGLYDGLLIDGFNIVSFLSTSVFNVYSARIVYWLIFSPASSCMPLPSRICIHEWFERILHYLISKTDSWAWMSTKDSASVVSRTSMFPWITTHHSCMVDSDYRLLNNESIIRCLYNGTLVRSSWISGKFCSCIFDTDSLLMDL